MESNKIHTDKNVTDMLTKVIPRGKFNLCTWLARLSSKLCDED